MVLVYLAFYEVSTFGAALAFLLGLQLDVSSAKLLGPWAGSFVLVYGFLGPLSQRIFIDTRM